MPDKYQVIKINTSSKDKINPCDVFIPSNEFIDESENYK
jgi:hypothetical protein